MLKACLRGKKPLGSVCPISGFPVVSPAVRDEIHLKVLAALLPPRLSKLETAVRDLCKPLDHGSSGIPALVVSGQEFRHLEGAASCSVWFGVYSAFLTQLAGEGKYSQEFCQCGACMCLKF